MFWTDRSIPIPERALDEVELADEVEGDTCVTAGGVVSDLSLARLVKLATHVRETSGVDEVQRLRNRLVGLVAVGELAVTEGAAPVGDRGGVDVVGHEQYGGFTFMCDRT